MDFVHAGGAGVRLRPGKNSGNLAHFRVPRRNPQPPPRLEPFRTVVLLLGFFRRRRAAGAGAQVEGDARVRVERGRRLLLQVSCQIRNKNDVLRFVCLSTPTTLGVSCASCTCLLGFFRSWKTASIARIASPASAGGSLVWLI